MLAALCMFGGGPLKDRVQLCFEVFDDDGNCLIDQPEMVDFMMACLKTMVAIDVMPKTPSREVLQVKTAPRSAVQSSTCR